MDSRYRPLILECGHYGLIGSYENNRCPRLGDDRFCLRCGRITTITVVGALWRVRCKDCRMGGVRESGSLARATARSHMLRTRHTVLVFDWARAVEVTLEIFELATDVQLPLDGSPPF